MVSIGTPFSSAATRVLFCGSGELGKEDHVRGLGFLQNLESHRSMLQSDPWLIWTVLVDPKHYQEIVAPVVLGIPDHFAQTRMSQPTASLQ